MAKKESNKPSRYRLSQVENVDLAGVSTSIGRIFKRCLPECSDGCRTHAWSYQDYGVVRGGKRVKQKTRKVGPHKEVAVSELRAYHRGVLAEVDAARGDDDEAGKTFETFAHEWLENREQGHLGRKMSRVTASTYRMYLARLDPVFLNKPLGRIRAADVRAAMEADANAHAAHRKTSDPYNSASTRRLWALLRAVLKAAGSAVQPEATDRLKVRPPSEPDGDEYEHTWEDAEIAAFLAASNELRYRAAFVLMLGSGFRRGELLGLRWKNVRFNPDGTATLLMRETVSLMNKGRMVRGKGKTDGSKRDVPVTADVADVLREWKDEQDRERRENGADWRRGVTDPDLEPADSVFTTFQGRLIRPETLSNVFAAQVSRAGVPSIRLHELRDHYAMMLLHVGVDIYPVSKLLGHTSPKTTEKRYARYAPSKMAEQVARTAGHLGKLLEQGAEARDPAA